MFLNELWTIEVYNFYYGNKRIFIKWNKIFGNKI